MAKAQIKEEVVQMNKLETLMAEKGQPTLKALAHVFGLNPIRLYSVAKQPKEGEIYDAKVYNWDAVERFVERRLEPDSELATLEAVIEKALAADEEFKLTDKRKSTGVKVETMEVDGQIIKKRKFTNFEMESGKLIVLTGDGNVYKIVYQTISHTVLVPVDAAGETTSSEVKVISNSMLNLKGIGPSILDKCIEDRFAGTWVAPTKK